MPLLKTVDGYCESVIVLSLLLILLLSIVFFIRFKFIYNKFIKTRPTLVCCFCGWKGDEQKLDVFSEGDKGPIFSACPRCGSLKISPIKY